MAKYILLKKRLFEAQRGRCAACTCHLLVQNSANSRDPRRLSLVCINNNMSVSYDNAILMCGKCAGWAGNYPSLEEFYENYIVQSKGKKEKVQNVYPETVPLINAFLVKMYKEADAISELSLIDAKSKYIHAPPENAEKIAKSLFAQYLRAQPKTYTYKTKVSRKKNNANGLLEAQNHRCCYCHYRFNNNKKSTRYATFEHVIPRKHGGTNHKWNLVMACAICNHTRDILNMTAEQFYYWVQENPNELLKLERAVISKKKNKSRKHT